MNANASLANRERPRTFATAIGAKQRITAEKIRKQGITGNYAHVYVFKGQKGTGKTTFARILMKAVNCTNRTPDGEPCCQCAACRRIEAEKSLDCFEINASDDNGVALAERLIEESKYRPLAEKYKVYILDECHMITTAAYNKMLKLFEDPPEYCIYILCTTNPEKMPATILSRAQIWQFSSVSFEELGRYISDMASRYGARVLPEAVDMIVRSSDGSVRDAIKLLEQCLEEGIEVTRDIVAGITGALPTGMIFELLQAISSDSRGRIIELVKAFYQEGRKPQDMITDIMAVLNDMIYVRAGQLPDRGEAYSALLKQHLLSENDAVDMELKLAEVRRRLTTDGSDSGLMIAGLLSVSMKQDVQFEVIRLKEEVEELHKEIEVLKTGISTGVNNVPAAIQTPSASHEDLKAKTATIIQVAEKAEQPAPKPVPAAPAKEVSPKSSWDLFDDEEDERFFFGAPEAAAEGGEAEGSDGFVPVENYPEEIPFSASATVTEFSDLSALASAVSGAADSSGYSYPDDNTVVAEEGTVLEARASDELFSDLNSLLTAVNQDVVKCDYKKMLDNAPLPKWTRKKIASKRVEETDMGLVIYVNSTEEWSELLEAVSASDLSFVEVRYDCPGVKNAEGKTVPDWGTILLHDPHCDEDDRDSIRDALRIADWYKWDNKPDGIYLTLISEDAKYSSMPGLFEYLMNAGVRYVHPVQYDPNVDWGDFFQDEDDF